ncbi:protein TBATA-like isoform X4 [Crassostrea angulata]|uniref:protein TBATA-like isoform X4 n=1 Tax=Magallana angulata TaxID=2784310 RepID=UPI0022B1F075|nr:protein TBATA-like isoform X4 [Crassostrea angulata]
MAMVHGQGKMFDMSQSEVFRPANGDLFARPGPVDEGYMASLDTFRKRPSTQGSTGGYRFGQLSQNSFFTRHNPHPSRVRHIKGLLDVPICAVNDDGYFASPKYSLQFPPNAFNNKQMNKWKGQVPVNAINVNSRLHPINTVTGLQYFTGLNSYPFREKAVPRVGMVPVTEQWRDELQQLTKAIGFGTDELAPQKPQAPGVPERPKTQYSETTGRIIPPPSRAMSRGKTGSRQGRDKYFGTLQHIAPEPDMETMVLQMLCQILQTEDINAVQAWLCSAGEREKTVVMDLIRSAVGSQSDYYQREVRPEYVEEGQVTKLPPINETGQIVGGGEKADRLTFKDPLAALDPESADMKMFSTMQGLVLSDPGVPGEPNVTEMKQAEQKVPTPPPKMVDDDLYPDPLGFDVEDTKLSHPSPTHLENSQVDPLPRLVEPEME